MSSQLADRLINTLNTANITYCHWKSNFSLAEAMSAEIDLDFLIDRQSLADTITILLDLGFKAATVKKGPVIAAIFHYYGFDPSVNQLVHVHLFSQVLTGESFVKSHLLPFEKMLLDNTEYIGSVKVDSKSAELILFTVRMFIKYGSPLDLLYIKGTEAQIKAELNWLQSGADMNKVFSLLEKYCPVIEKDLFLQCIDMLDKDNSLAQRILLALKVRRRLRVYQKYTLKSRGIAYAQLLWGQVLRKLTGNKKNKMLSTGGVIIAFTGPEATGKSTLVGETKTWLGEVFAVKVVHAGKPPSTWLTKPISLLLPLLRRNMPAMRTNSLEGHISSVGASQAPSKKGLAALIYAVRSVSLAWDRRQLLVGVRQAAANGQIVICDRYPSEEIGAMDSPRLRENPASRGIRATIYNWLARHEAQLYQQIGPPDIVLKLKVSIETAKKRNHERVKDGKESAAYVESRHRQSRNWHRSGTKYIYEINTEQSLPDTINSVKEAIWKSI